MDKKNCGKDMTNWTEWEKHCYWKSWLFVNLQTATILRVISG